MTDTRPTRATMAGRVYLDLRNLARRTRRSTQELLNLYTLEGYLARLAASPYADRLILKGGVLLAAYDTRRPTRDVDLQARQLANDARQILATVCDIASLDLGDGLSFATASATASLIREDHAYTGTRIRLAADLASARVVMGVDVNIGDPIWPPPQRIMLPGLLDRQVELLGYPLSMVHAEKIVTMLERGLVNTRWRDFADVYALSNRHSVSAAELRSSLERVASYRKVDLVPVAEALRDFPATAQPKWRSWHRKQQTAFVGPEDFGDTLTAITLFADPVLRGQVTMGSWNPTLREWGLL